MFKLIKWFLIFLGCLLKRLRKSTNIGSFPQNSGRLRVQQIVTMAAGSTGFTKSVVRVWVYVKDAGGNIIKTAEIWDDVYPRDSILNDVPTFGSTTVTGRSADTWGSIARGDLTTPAEGTYDVYMRLGNVSTGAEIMPETKYFSYTITAPVTVSAPVIDGSAISFKADTTLPEVWYATSGSGISQGGITTTDNVTTAFSGNKIGTFHSGKGDLRIYNVAIQYHQYCGAATVNRGTHKFTVKNAQGTVVKNQDIWSDNTKTTITGTPTSDASTLVKWSNWGAAWGATNRGDLTKDDAGVALPVGVYTLTLTTGDIVTPAQNLYSNIVLKYEIVAASVRLRLYNLTVHPIITA